jgi:hypothetical protein
MNAGKRDRRQPLTCFIVAMPALNLDVEFAEVR